MSSSLLVFIIKLRAVFRIGFPGCTKPCGASRNNKRPTYVTE